MHRFCLFVFVYLLLIDLYVYFSKVHHFHCWLLTSNILSPAPVHEFTYFSSLFLKREERSGDTHRERPLAARSLRTVCIFLVHLRWLAGELKLCVLWCFIFHIALKKKEKKKKGAPWSYLMYITYFDRENVLSMHALCWCK